MLRKRHIFIFIILLVIISILTFRRCNEIQEFTSGVLPGKDNIEIPRSVRNYLTTLETYLDSTHTVGAALTIVREDQVLILNSYGVKKTGTQDSVNKHTVFRLASCSKGFAGVLALLLEEDSLFSLEDPIIDFIPGFRLKDSVNTKQLNIRHTLSHTSGLVPHAFDNLIEDGIPLPLIIDQLSLVDISAPPGVLYGYQNVVFSLIDTVVRSKTGADYKQLLQRRVFRPLNMRDASASEDIFLKRNGNFAYPHARLRSSRYYPLQVNLGYYNIAPAAGVNASISDMSKWLLALLGNNPEVLDQELLKRIAEPVVISPLKWRYIRPWGKLESKHYGLGWRIYQKKRKKIVYHGGYVKGYRAEIAFCPEEKTGIAFLQNSPNYLASLSIPRFFEYYFNEVDSLQSDSLNILPFPWFEWFEDSVVNSTEGKLSEESLIMINP